MLGEGAADYVLLQNGQRGLVRRLREDGTYQLTNLGRRFFKNKYSQHVAHIPVVIKGMRRAGKNAGRAYERRDWLPANVLGGEASRQPDRLSEQQILQNVKQETLRLITAGRGPRRRQGAHHGTQRRDVLLRPGGGVGGVLGDDAIPEQPRTRRNHPAAEAARPAPRVVPTAVLQQYPGMRIRGFRGQRLRAAAAGSTPGRALRGGLRTPLQSTTGARTASRRWRYEPSARGATRPWSSSPTQASGPLRARAVGDQDGVHLPRRARLLLPERPAGAGADGLRAGHVPARPEADRAAAGGVEPVVGRDQAGSLPHDGPTAARGAQPAGHAPLARAVLMRAKGGQCVIRELPEDWELLQAWAKGPGLHYRGQRLASLSFEAFSTLVKAPRITPSQRQKKLLLAEQGGKCAACGQQIGAGCAEFDHIVPVRQAFAGQQQRFQALCFECHQMKTQTESMQPTSLESRFTRSVYDAYVRSPKQPPLVFQAQAAGSGRRRLDGRGRPCGALPGRPIAPARRAARHRQDAPGADHRDQAAGAR